MWTQSQMWSPKLLCRVVCVDNAPPRPVGPSGQGSVLRRHYTGSAVDRVYVGSSGSWSPKVPSWSVRNPAAGSSGRRSWWVFRGSEAPLLPVSRWAQGVRPPGTPAASNRKPLLFDPNG